MKPSAPLLPVCSMRLSSVFYGLMLLALASCAGKTSLPSVTSLPNVVFVLVDDMGRGDPQVYNPDSKIPTPNMDNLARTGMLFTDAHSSSALCAPTRYSVMTGNYPFRGRKVLGVWPAFDEPMVLPDQRTIGHIMQAAGYNTAMFGKLNNGGLFHDKSGNGYTNKPANIDFSRGYDQGPTQEGFDYSFNLLVGIQAQPYAYFENDRLVGNPVDLIHRPATRDGSVRNEGLALPDYDSREAGPTLCNKALDFIDRHCREQKNRPFFLYYAAQAAHSPYTPPVRLNGLPVQGVTGVSNRSDMVHEADVVIGQLLQKLEDENVLQNTLFIVTSDNGASAIAVRPDGPEVQHGHLNAQGVIDDIPLRGNKGTIYEGGHRVSFIARWGDGTAAGSRIAPGSVSKETICLQDLAATLLALTGQSMPHDQYRDSYNFLPALFGQQPGVPVRDVLLSQSGTLRKLDNNRQEFQRAIRVGPWKLIVSSEASNAGEALTKYTDMLAFYNLEQDLGEQQNLANQPEHRQHMQEMAEQLFRISQSERSSPVFKK